MDPIKVPAAGKAPRGDGGVELRGFDGAIPHQDRNTSGAPTNGTPNRDIYWSEMHLFLDSELTTAGDKINCLC